MAFFSGLRAGYRPDFDPSAMPPAGHPLADAYYATLEMARRYQQLQAEHQRLSQRDQRDSGRRQAVSGRASARSSTGVGGHASGEIEDGTTRTVLNDAGRHIVGIGSNTDSVRNKLLAQEKQRRSGELTGWGYRPTREDRELLARIIYAESFDTPEDDAAIGWATINRVGRPGFAGTLEGVLRQPGQFQIVSEGNRGRNDNPRWTESAHPEGLSPPRRARLRRARDIADGILSGRILDPTGDAPYFLSSDNPSNPTGNSPWFSRALEEKNILPSFYTSRARGSRRNYFYNERKRP